MDKLFFVLAKSKDSGWSALAGPLTAAAAETVARELLSKNLGLRVVVARAVRSFTSRPEVVEDAAPVLEDAQPVG